MRSIGKVKIKKLKRIVQEEVEKERQDMFGVSWGLIRKNVSERIPEDWYDTWEMAYSEIARLTDDFINDFRFNKGGLK